MKPKKIIIGVVVVACVGAAVFALIKLPKAAHDSDDESPPENVPTLVTVQVGSLKRMTLHHYVMGYGTVGPTPATATEPAASAPLAAPVAGVVTRVNAVEGQQVKQGDVLVELNSGTMTVDRAKQELERQRQLYAEHNTSLKNLQDAEAQMSLLRVVAPLSGTITRINVKPGSAVDANTVVAEVIDLSRLSAAAEIPEAEAGQLKAGLEIQLLTKPPMQAALSYVSPAVDASNGTILVRSELPADSGLRPGQFVQLQIVTAVHTNCLAAPENSVVTDTKGQSVIALVSGEEAARAPVQTGFREDGWVEVEGRGLKEGDTVVTVGAYGLPEKTKIRVVSP